MSTESSADGLSERDRVALGVTDTDVTEAEPEQDDIEALRARNEALEDEVQDLRDELTATKQTLFAELNKLRDQMDGKDATDPRATPRYENLTLIEKYARMDEAEREELLSASKQRAVLILENWNDWAKQVQAGQVITTNQTRGKNSRTAIRVDLQTAIGQDLQSVEVYRAMKQVAKLSAADPDDVTVTTDEYGREHITGGRFEYHEKVNPDTSGSNRKFKLLKLVEPEAINIP